MTSTTKQTIAIIGVGSDMGSAIATKLAAGNYRLLLFDTSLEPLKSLAKEIRTEHKEADLDIMDCPHDSCWEADIIILAVPVQEQKPIADKIRPVATQKIVVSLSDSSYRASPDYMYTYVAAGIKKLQEWLPHSNIVEALNVAPPEDIGQVQADEKRSNIYLRGDDLSALDTIFEMTKNAGFNPVITGS